MRVTLHLLSRATYADYLAADQMSPLRYEFFDGVVVAMPGCSDEHNALWGRIAGLCAMRLSAPCRYYSPDQRFWIAAARHGRYSDGSIICGSPDHPPHDAQATLNPLVVFEVLSPSSEGDDEGDKRSDFQTLPSLAAYVVAAQDARALRIYRRDEHGAWRDLPDTYRDGDAFTLPALSQPIAVADLYDGVVDADGRSLLR